MKTFVVLLMFFGLGAVKCMAQTPSFTPVPYSFAPGDTVIPNQLMVNFLSLIASGNAVVSNLNSKVTALSPVPSGAIIFFDLSSCPATWTAVPATNGLFVRDLDSGAGVDPTGTALGGTETGGMQDHIHNTDTPFIGVASAATFAVAGPQTQPTQFTLTTNDVTGNPNTGNHGAEVRPKNVSLILCSKD
jgi:hypothetical protein